VLFESSPLPIIVYDRGSLRLLAVSNTAVQEYGYSRDELLAMTLPELLPAEDQAALAHFLTVELDGAHPGLIEQRPWHFQYKDGTVIDIEVTSDDLDFNGVACRMAFCEDVTDQNKNAVELATTREQLQVSEARYRMMFERNPQPIVTFNRKTLAIMAVSNAMVNSFGYSREEFQTMSILDLALPEDVDVLRGFFASSPTGSRPSPDGNTLGYPRRRQRKDGTIVDVEITSDNVELDGMECRIALYADVTERNRIAAEIVVARDRAVEASNTKSAFLANMSHELRTPMNGVIGMNALLLGTELNEDQRRFAEQVTQSGEQMLAIINDILDVSKLEAGQLELDETDFELRDTVESACSGPRVAAAVKGLAFELEVGANVPRILRGDSRRLQQVLANLTSNAVKFTPAGGVALRVGASAGSHGRTLIELEIEDTGIGIDLAQLQQLFEPFTQADVSTTRLYGGTGLGLAIVRELVELMGGRVSADSVPGKGTTFRVALELAAPAGTASAATSEPDALPTAEDWTSQPLVLVAEDSPVNQIVAARTLERLGCRADVVDDGEAALAALALRHYDAVLMDCQMPRIDGYAATSELRRREHGSRHTPVIAMTAHAMAGDRELCIASGMDDYIAKPMRRGELADALHRWIPPMPADGAPAQAEARPAAATTK
jgi:PAS domain S-box-containing protein